MLENPRRGRQARNLTSNVPKILDLKSSSEQIFSKNCRWVPLCSEMKWSEPPSLSKVISFCSLIALALIYFGLTFLNKVASVCYFYWIAQNALPVPFSYQKRRQTNTEDNPSYCVNQLFIHKCEGWFRLKNLISRFQFIFTMYNGLQFLPLKINHYAFMH